MGGGFAGGTDAQIAREYRARYRSRFRNAFASLGKILRKAITPIMVIAGSGLILFFVLTGSKTGFYVFLVYLPIAWLLIFILAATTPEKLNSIRYLLKSFEYQVDRAKQNLGNDHKSIDEQVRKAFLRLHGEVQALLQYKKIKMSQVKREVLRFHAPDEPLEARWRPPTLSEMGYVLAAADTYAPYTAVLALYKYSGEARSRNGTIVDAYTILQEGFDATFSAAFAARVQSPFPIHLDAPDNTHTSVAATASIANERGNADTEHHVAYILSLLGPLTWPTATALDANLRAMAALAADTPRSALLSAISARGILRSLFTEGISHLQSSLHLANAALRQTPLPFVCALAGIARDNSDNHKRLFTLLDTVAEILVPSAASSRADLADLLKASAATIQRFEVIPADKPIAHAGRVYAEARGAEADAEFFNKIKQLYDADTHSADAPVPLVVMTTNFTFKAFQSLLRSYGELQPGKTQQAIIDTLLAALNDGRLRLNTVEGNNVVQVNNQPLIFSANAALVAVDGVNSAARYVLWTLAGQALAVPGDQLGHLLETARKISVYGADIG